MMVTWCLLLVLLDFTSVFSFHVADKSVSTLRVKRQSQEPAQPKRIVCYYAYWASKRPGNYKFTPKNIDPTLCTHIMYAYARLEPNRGIVAYDAKEDIENNGWKNIVELKNINPQAKIMLSMGGLFEGSARFTKMAADRKQREIFVESASSILKENGFDGLDMSWLYPGFSEGSSQADKANYVTLMKALREEFKDEFILSMTGPALVQYIDSGFDLPEITKYVDYINVLAYSYHDSTDATVNHHGPLYSLPNDPLNKDANVDATIRFYINRGVKSSMINLVIPLYGVAFILEDSEKTDIGSNTQDEGIGLEEPGAFIYFELCQKIRKENWTVKKINSTAMGPYAFKDKQWVAYDDEDMVRNKARYALQMGLGGIAFWTIDQDDFRGICHVQNFPLVRAGGEVFLEGNSIVGNTELPTTETTTPTTTDTTAPTTTETTTPTTTTASSSSIIGSLSPLNGGELQLPPTTYRPPVVTSRNPPKRTTSTTSIEVVSVALPNRSPPPRNSKKSGTPPESWTTIDRDVFPKRDKSDKHVVYRSNRDIIFSDINIWITNHFNRFV